MRASSASAPMLSPLARRISACRSWAALLVGAVLSAGACLSRRPSDPAAEGTLPRHRNARARRTRRARDHHRKPLDRWSRRHACRAADAVRMARHRIRHLVLDNGRPSRSRRMDRAQSDETPTGRAFRALHDSEVAARVVGIDVSRFKLQAFVIASVYASIAGSVLALMNGFINPDQAGFLHSVELVTMVVLGGLGSVVGSIVGAAVAGDAAAASHRLPGIRAPAARPHHHPVDDLHAGWHCAEHCRSCLHGRRAHDDPRSQRHRHLLRRRQGRRRRELLRQSGADPVDHRPERRRKDHAFQRRLRRLRSAARPCPSLRRGRNRVCAAQPRGARPLPHLPEPADLPAHDARTRTSWSDAICAKAAICLPTFQAAVGDAAEPRDA